MIERPPPWHRGPDQSSGWPPPWRKPSESGWPEIRDGGPRMPGLDGARCAPGGNPVVPPHAWSGVPDDVVLTPDGAAYADELAEAAVHLCLTACPCLAACTAWALALPDVPAGDRVIVAGMRPAEIRKARRRQRG